MQRVVSLITRRTFPHWLAYLIANLQLTALTQTALDGLRLVISYSYNHLIV
jgi:hypothetical protein